MPPTVFCTFPFTWSALPSASVLLSPVTLPATSLTLPLACSAVPSMRSLSIGLSCDEKTTQEPQHRSRMGRMFSVQHRQRTAEGVKTYNAHPVRPSKTSATNRPKLEERRAEIHRELRRATDEILSRLCPETLRERIGRCGFNDITVEVKGHLKALLDAAG